MANLLFFDQGHRYEVDGEEVPSVSELTRFMSREIYGTVNQYTLDQAAERGTSVHKLCEALDKYGTIECPEHLTGYLQGYLQFLKEHKPEWEYIEKPICHPDKLYAGTLDRYGTMDGKTVLVDIKTSSAIQKPLYGAQLNLYRLALVKPVEGLYILHLKKDGTYKLVEMPQEDAMAQACITLHYALKKKKRKRKEKT
jgi:ATP-dependent exoDNAse (exonuclease V) beta subunit